jgi:Cu+-exporting ATPase
LWLNIFATVVLVLLFIASRRKLTSTHFATDPVCGMQVDTSAPAATIRSGETTYYFCSPRCADRFQEGKTSSDVLRSTTQHSAQFAVDPICGMNVEITADAVFSVAGGKKTYFCCTGCRDSYEANLTAQ